jgi:hypothetical protein
LTVTVSALRPDKLPIDPAAVADFLGEMRKTEAFAPADVEWAESILTRPDNADGYHQLTGSFIFPRHDNGENLYQACKAYNASKEKLTPVELYDAKRTLAHLLWSKRVSMYRQKKLLVAAPQRKQHPKYPTPNLDKFEGAGQHVSTQLVALYGMDYCQARTTAVKQALADQDATHIMFVDDDVLIPKNAAQILINTGLKSVAGIYTKKTPCVATNTTTSGDDPDYVYQQQLVEPKQGDLAPVPVSCCGGGMWLLDLELFRRIPEPWFEMVRGPDGGVVIGEDSLWCQKLAAYGVQTFVLPGLCGVHVDFTSGRHYGPEWLVDHTTWKIRPEHAEKYQSFPADVSVAELIAPDVVDYFGKNQRLKEMGAIK